MTKVPKFTQYGRNKHIALKAFFMGFVIEL